MNFTEWLVEHGCVKESKERYTLSRVFLYELYLREKDRGDI